mmetsp:Transcript_38852/g.85393  ORF Transcript_38852/g.85393 Transcript_38852/m.85393 type:complete len:124 (-) Transcript_38852:186-557(-)
MHIVRNGSFKSMRWRSLARFACKDVLYRKHSAQFDSWLQRVMCDQNLSAEQRFAELAKWEQAPSAHEAHPRSAAEHLMPAFVVAGAGGGHAATVVGAGHKNAKVESVQWQALSKFASSQFEFV